MWPFRKSEVPPAPESKSTFTSLAQALSLAAEHIDRPSYPLCAPKLPPGVVPEGEKAAIAMDSDIPGVQANYQYMMGARDFIGFPGYQYLSMLSTRAEYRAFAETHSTELTREWITLNSTETAGKKTKEKVTELTQFLDEIHLRKIIQTCSQHEYYFGRGQIFLDIEGADKAIPLILDSRTIKRDSFKGVCTVEPMWTSPLDYNALDPTSPTFYRPPKWWMLSQPVHASRLLTVITRPLPDILKPAFNFSGMSMSQLVEPYVDNWLRTRQSVADLINNFSIIVLKTATQQMLQGNSDDAVSVFQRIKLFVTTRSNKGVMVLDNATEELQQIAVPLGGIADLQTKSLELLCYVGHEPAVILMGIQPSGLNASSEGELSAHYNWIAANQESFYRQPIETVLKVAQLSKYGEIDPDITFVFNPLKQADPKELAEIRTANGATAVAYIDRGVLDPSEERERLARDSESGYQGLDMSVTPELPEEKVTDNNDDSES